MLNLAFAPAPSLAHPHVHTCMHSPKDHPACKGAQDHPACVTSHAR